MILRKTRNGDDITCAIWADAVMRDGVSVIAKPADFKNANKRRKLAAKFWAMRAIARTPTVYPVPGYIHDGRA